MGLSSISIDPAVLFSFFLLNSLLIPLVSGSSVMWSHTYGSEEEAAMAYSLVETSDGGYAIAGGGMAPGSSYNYWLVKIDRYGEEEWNQTYIGGTGSEWINSIIETSDGGFAIVGGGSLGAGSFDCWFIKTDQQGNAQWNRTYGGAEWDEAYSMLETSDRGYVLAGETYSFGAGNSDFWLVKTDETGNIEWSQTYGGQNYDSGKSLIATSDGGCCLVGNTKSFGAGNADCWLVKIDSKGNIQWNQTYGGTGNDWGYSVIATSDGGYAMAGGTESFGIETQDFWLIKTNWFGEMEWNQKYVGPEPYGEPQSEHARSLVQASDGGYVLAGITRLENTTAHPFDTDDVWLIKTDESGKLEWNQTYGGSGDQGAYSLVATSDGGYALAGYSLAGSMKFLVIKTNEYGNIPEFPSNAILVSGFLMITIMSIIYRQKRKLSN